MFYLKLHNLDERTALLNHLKQNDILAVFHYVPLHSAPAGQQYGRFFGNDIYTTSESEKLIRLPIWYRMDKQTSEYILQRVLVFYQNHKFN
jgi:dTDP-4-amino-4,6-dideoxygalactose transaminase